MKKLMIIIMFLCICLSGCIATWGGIEYETSNTVVLEIENKPEKSTFNLFISARDTAQFKGIVESVADYLKAWEAGISNNTEK